MNIRLYLEEDSMGHVLVRGLRARGVNVVTALEEAMIERNDKEHLEFAAKTGRVLYSFNVADFYYLHSRITLREREHAGLILTSAAVHNRRANTLASKADR